MKKIILVICAIAGGTLSAQFDPIGQLTMKAIMPNIISHDSITYSLDTGANFYAEQASWQNYLLNGYLDTAVIYDQGSPALSYGGEWDGVSKTTLVGYDLSMGGQDTVEMYDMYQDRQRRDSVLNLYVDVMGSMMPVLQLSFDYNTSGRITAMNYTFFVGVPSFSYEFYYQSQLRDSIYIEVDNDRIYYKYRYKTGQANQIDEVEVYQDSSNIWQLVGILDPVYNQNGEITELLQLSNNPASNLRTLDGVVRYGIHSQSSISLPGIASAELALYPNPATSWLKIAGLSYGDYNYSINSLDGRQITSGKFEGTISLESMPQGVYTLQLWKGAEQVSLPFIKH